MVLQPSVPPFPSPVSSFPSPFEAHPLENCWVWYHDPGAIQTFWQWCHNCWRIQNSIWEAFEEEDLVSKVPPLVKKKISQSATGNLRLLPFQSFCSVSNSFISINYSPSHNFLSSCLTIIIIIILKHSYSHLHVYPHLHSIVHFQKWLLEVTFKSEVQPATYAP